MPRYGRADCEHIWRYRKDGWEEGCGPAVCIRCGAFGCFCDVYKTKPCPSKKVFFKQGQNGDANINGCWVNPYVKKGD